MSQHPLPPHGEPVSASAEWFRQRILELIKLLGAVGITIDINTRLMEVSKVLEILVDRGNRGRELDNLMNGVRIAIGKRIRGLPFGVLANRWFFLRQFISLQARLYWEYVFWNVGDPYRRLVTGFNPGDIAKVVAREEELILDPGLGGRGESF